MDKLAVPKENILYLIIGLAVMVLGYLFLLGGGSGDPERFSYALFSFSRLYIAPLLIVGGFVIELAVLLQKKARTVFKKKK